MMQVQRLLRVAVRKKRDYMGIYPSQRQNLLPTLEILIKNFENFQIFKFWEKIPKFPFFFLQNFQNHKGAATDIKGAAASSLPNYKIIIFFKSFQSSGYIT